MVYFLGPPGIDVLRGVVCVGRSRITRAPARGWTATAIRTDIATTRRTTAASTTPTASATRTIRHRTPTLPAST